MTPVLRLAPGGEHAAQRFPRSARHPPRVAHVRCGANFGSDHAYSITSSARCWRNQGMSTPSALAVLRLITSTRGVVDITQDARLQLQILQSMLDDIADADDTGQFAAA
jgi:hypothetical protein